MNMRGKKLIAVLLSVFMLVGMIPITVFAETTDVPVTETIYWGIDANTNGTLYLSANPLTAEQTAYQSGSFSGDNEGTSDPWNGCDKDCVSSVKTLSEISPKSTASWFLNFTNASSMDLNKLNTTNVKSMHFMFSSCSDLITLDLSSFDTKNVTNMSAMFSGCSSLTALAVNNFDTKNVTDMSYMFSGCSALTSLAVNNFDTTNVTTMSYMFAGCSSLTALAVNNFDTTNVKNMRRMFSGCSGLTTLDLSNFNTTNLTDMLQMFSNCSSLTALDLSNFDITNVISLTDMLNGNSSLKTIKVSGSINEKISATSLPMPSTSLSYDGKWHLNQDCSDAGYSNLADMQARGAVESTYYAVNFEVEKEAVKAKLEKIVTDEYGLIESAPQNVKDVLKEAEDAVGAAKNQEELDAAEEQGEEAIKAAIELAKAKEDAKEAIDAEAGENPSEKVKEIADEYKEKINAATSISAVEAARDEGIEEIKKHKGLSVISGNIASYGNETDAITVNLISNASKEIVKTLEITQQEKGGKGLIAEYAFDEVASGNYIIEIYKKDHKPRCYPIYVENGGEYKLDANISLIGDVNDDGKINITDVTIIYAHTKGTKDLSGYTFDCADVNDDGKVNIIDVNKVYETVRS